MIEPIEIMTDSEADRDAWLENRLDYINSTESAALFGLSKYMTEFELWHLKKNREQIAFTETTRTRAGRFLEDAIARLALDDLQATGQPFKKYLRRPDCRMASSFDWEITSGQLAGWLLEVKSVDFMVYKNDWIDGLPPHHIEIQVQHELAVSQRKGCVIAALVGGNDLKIIERPADNEMADMIVGAVNKFWSTIDANQPPQPNFERDSEFLCQMYRHAGGAPFIATGADYIANLIEEDDALKAAKSRIEKRRDEIKAECFTIIGTADQVIIDGKKRRSCTETAANPGTTITAEMVGQIINARKSFRNWR